MQTATVLVYAPDTAARVTLNHPQRAPEGRTGRIQFLSVRP